VGKPMSKVFSDSIHAGLLLATLVALAPQAGAQDRQGRTPLGTQTASPVEQLKEVQRERDRQPAVAPEPLTRAMERAEVVHGGRQTLLNIADSTAEGVFTRFSSDGEARSYPVTLFGKGASQVQRIIRQPGGDARQGADGLQTWDSFGGHYTAAYGSGLSFLETHTVRSLRSLFDYQARGSRLKDLGIKDAHRVVEVEDGNGRATTYFLEASGRVAKIEFMHTLGVHMLTGKPMAVVESYQLSEYRTVQGVLTPMKIEHFSGGTRVDAMEFKSVRHNAALPDNTFRP
jgi:hypothetical protein